MIRVNNKGQERPKCFSIPYDFGSHRRVSSSSARLSKHDHRSSYRGGDGVSHMTERGAVRYR